VTPGMTPVDLRSDFLARPTDAMLAAAEAARDSRHFGLREDPWQRRLEARIAELTGHEDALVFPTCTMANTAALLLHAPPGSRVITQADAHVFLSEAGAGAAFGGLTLRPLAAAGAMPPLDNWQRALAEAGDAQRPAVRLCVLENTHNRTGGTPLPVDYVNGVVALAKSAGVKTHLDGARLFDAAHALGTTTVELASAFDSVSVSLNKGFGAPIAAALAASTATIAAALPLRQRLGGGLRPTGPSAAATFTGLADLTHFATVHALAARLAEGLRDNPKLRVEDMRVRTSMVIAHVAAPLDATSACALFAEQGLLALPFDASRIRFVVYRGIVADDIERAILAARVALR